MLLHYLGVVFVCFLAIELLEKIYLAYYVPWFDVFYDNPIMGSTAAGFFLLQPFFFCCFKPVRLVFWIVGLLGSVAMTVKILTQPVNIASISNYTLEHNWPSLDDIEAMRHLYITLLIEGMVFKYYYRFVKIAFNWLKNRGQAA